MDTPSVTAASAIGGRSHQEDRWIASLIPNSTSPQGWLLSVLDGHGGAQTSDRSANRLLDLFQSSLKESSDPPAAIKQCVATLVAEAESDTSGSTLSLVYIPAQGDRLWGAVLGDSPVAVLDRSSHLVIAPEHNVRTNESERLDALRRGGSFAGGYLLDPENPGLALQMSRALGDRELARLLRRDPEMFEMSLGPDSVILVGSDGLLNAFEGFIEKQLMHLLQMIKNGAEATDIVQDALQRGAEDNVTAIVWRARRSL